MRPASETGRRAAPRRDANAGVFHQMYADHAGVLFGYFARRVGPDLAEDLLAETFHVAIESFASFDARRGGERAWLFGIGSNLLRHHWRTEQRRLRALARDAARPPTNIDPLLAVGDHVAERLDAVEAADRVIDALAGLSPDDRTLLFLSGWERMNSSEIGAAIGQPAATVRSRLRRLRRQLRTTATALPDDQEALR